MNKKQVYIGMGVLLVAVGLYLYMKREKPVVPDADPSDAEEANKSVLGATATDKELLPGVINDPAVVAAILETEAYKREFLADWMSNSDIEFAPRKAEQFGTWPAQDLDVLVEFLRAEQAGAYISPKLQSDFTKIMIRFYNNTP